MDKLNRNEEEKSHADSCAYCAALAEVADPEEGDCHYCIAIHDSHGDEIDSECKYCVQSQQSDQATEEVVSEEVDSNSPPLGESDVVASEPQQGYEKVNIIPRETIQSDTSKEAIQEIAQTIAMSDGAPPDTTEEMQRDVGVANSIDNAGVAPGKFMIDGKSVPEHFDENTPGDMALDEENTAITPNISSVLKEGLESKSDSIKKERIINMAAEALEGFKSCKPILEKAKQQAPELYRSSILMLKAMIEMSKMINTDKSPDMNPDISTEREEENPWNDPFPKHVTPAEEENPWNNPFPKYVSSADGDKNLVGQPVGKLPTSATTQHVAKVPIAPGSVNAQGQMRYVDPNTGKESFIDMKQGRVLSNTGKPVKG